MGLGGCDWQSADIVFRALKINLDEELHTKLRIVFGEIMVIESERHREQKEKRRQGSARGSNKDMDEDRNNDWTREAW